MLTIGISLSSSIKLLERKLMVRVRSINRAAWEAVYSLTPAVTVADTHTAVADALQPLGIAKTVMPEQRMDFNGTFQHVRFELDVLYKKHNPMFTNTEVSGVWEGTQTASMKVLNSGDGSVDRPLESATASPEWHAETPALWISKTTLPDTRLDFNQTFEKVRNELDAIYKKQNPNFTALTNQQDTASADHVDRAATLSATLSPARSEFKQEGRTLVLIDRAPMGNRQARKSMRM